MAMNRLVVLTGLGVILVVLFSDVALLLKYQDKPDTFALMQQVSTVHAFLLHAVGPQFASVKLLASVLMTVCWARKLFVPTKAEALKQATVAYALLWTLIGVLVLTGVVGTLQYVAGMDIAVYDFSPLVQSVGWTRLLSIVAPVVVFPLVLMALPALYNRSLKVA